MEEKNKIESVNFYEELLNSKENFNKNDFNFISSFRQLLSPEFPTSFVVKKIPFFSISQYMQYCKAKTFNDEAIAEKLLIMSSGKENWYNLSNEIIGQKPTAINLFCHGEIITRDLLMSSEHSESWQREHKKIKELGRQVKNFNPYIWKYYRQKFYKRGMIENMAQNNKIMVELYKTNGKIIILSEEENSEWGINLKPNDTININASKELIGKNIVGKVLTNYREEYNLILKNENKANPIQVENSKKRNKIRLF